MLGPVSTGIRDRLQVQLTIYLIYKQPQRSTQPGHPSIGKHNENQPITGDAAQLGIITGTVRV